MLVGARAIRAEVFPVEWRLNIGGRELAISDVIAHIDADILKLQQAKLVLMGGSAAAPAAAAEVAVAPVKSGRRGRPKGSKNAKAVEVKAPAAVKAPATKAAAKTTKRKLSPEGRKAIAEAMKRRWAERRKLAVK